MEEIRSRHKTLQSTAHHIALECINPQDARAYSTPSDSPILGRALCLTPRGSPLPGRVSHLSDKFQDSVTLTSDTEALVAKISAMFPTVSETHIKILLKKYYNREAVVISALQVEKHPISTPGPLSMSPAAGRLQRGALGVCSAVHLAKAGSAHGSSTAHHTPLTGTPHGSPSLLRPASGASSYYGTTKSFEGHPTRSHSPKMKLKYLKSIFPKAEETLILDILANKDNNVQKASEELLHMGFPKKETIINNPPIKKKDKDHVQLPKKVVTIMKTMEEKNILKQKLSKKYSSVPERVVGIALESAEYHEERAEQILSAVLQEPPPPPGAGAPAAAPLAAPLAARALSEGGAAAAEPPARDARAPLARSPRAAVAPLFAPAARRFKSWTDHLKPILKATSAAVEPKYNSYYSTPSVGPNPGLCKGPKENLLLEDYMAWNGPNPELRSAQTIKPEGPELREIKLSLARGPTPGLAKGPAGLAKGSIYQKIAKKSAKMCVH